MHKTHSKVLLVLWYQGSTKAQHVYIHIIKNNIITNVARSSIQSTRMDVEEGGGREVQTKFEKGEGGGGWQAKQGGQEPSANYVIDNFTSVLHVCGFTPFFYQPISSAFYFLSLQLVEEETLKCRCDCRPRAEKFDIISKDHGRIQKCDFCVLDMKHYFWEYLVQKIKAVRFSLNLVPRLIRICRIQW